MNSQTKCALLASASLAAVIGLSAPAAAQTAPAPAPAEPSSVGEIVVTGSRVITNGNASPTPLTVVSAESLTRNTPGPIAEAVAELPTFAGSRTGTSNPGSGTANAGADHLGLRYLGYQRTLILLDGKRLAPSTFDQLVDIDTVPQMLLQRVDVVTGGVSAVYGSDAVAGVVNFVTDTHFNGLKINGQYGISGHSDDPTQNVGIAAGTSVLDGRGHFEFSYQYQNDDGISRRSSRDWGLARYGLFGAGTAASPLHLTYDSRVSNTTFGGLITSATGAGAGLANQMFASNGVLSPFVNGIATGTSGVQSGGSGAYNDASIKAALNTHQLFGRFDYDFNNNIHGYVEGAYNQDKTKTFGNYNTLSNVTFNGQNPLLPTASQFAGTLKLSEYLSDFPRVITDTTQKQYFVIAGLDGDFHGWKWGVGINQAQADATTSNPSQIDNQKLYAALDVTKDANGNAVCRSSLTNPGLFAGCAPLNVFGPTAANQAAINYVLATSQFENINTQTDLTANIAGTLFNDWAGPVGVAISGEWRRQTLQVNSNEQPSDVVNCTDLTANCTPGGTARWADSVLASLPQVGVNVGEAAIETNVPLINEKPFFKDVSFNGAVRYTNYSTSGGVGTWKVGLNWQVNDEVKLRVTRSRDIRAPNLYDLYQPKGVTIGTFNDVLTNKQVTVPLYSGGDPTLKPEIGDTVTAGIVYKPAWLPRFSFSIDAYKIDISNALFASNASNSGTQQICYLSGGTSGICSLIIRPGSPTDASPGNAATAFYNIQQNIASSTTYGADFEAGYSATVFGNPLSLRGLLSWQPHLVIIQPGGVQTEGAGQAYSGANINGATALAQVRSMIFVDYKIGDFAISLRERWRSPLTNRVTTGLIYADPATIPSAYYTDTNFSYTLRRDGIGSTELYLNIQNLLDQQPPIAARSDAARIGLFGGFAQGDDPIGRYFTIGFRFRH